MAKPRPTPEEKLLELIEKGDAGPETVRFKRRRSFFLGFSRIGAFGQSLNRRIAQKLTRLRGAAREPNLKVLNRVFLVLSLILLSYSIVDFVFGRPDIELVYKKLKTPRETRTQEETLVEARPFLHYLEMVRRRNIFSPIELKKEAEQTAETRKEAQEMARDLRLVGISLEKEPLAMIEDKTKNKTFFLKKGEMINNFSIEDILEDRVILGYQGEKIELL